VEIPLTHKSYCSLFNEQLKYSPPPGQYQQIFALFSGWERNIEDFALGCLTSCDLGPNGGIIKQKVKKGNFSLAFFNLSMYNTLVKVGMCWGQRQIPLVPLILRFFV
jgi:hypothetical protein